MGKQKTPTEITWSVGQVKVTLNNRGVTVTTRGTALFVGSREVDALVDMITTAQELAGSDKWWVPQAEGGDLPC